MSKFFQKYQKFFVTVFFLIFLSIGGFFGYKYLDRYYFSEKIQVIFFQINRGDASYIKTPHGKEILIDGGQDLSILSSLEKHRPFYDRHIDLLIITHPDSDHYYGLVEVLRRFSVDNVLLTGVKKDDPMYHKIFTLAQEKNVQILYADRKKDFEVDNVFFDILSPLESILKTERNDNDDSLVVKMSYQNKTILFTGDIEKKTEKILLNSGVNLDSDILKIPHHGSKSSSSLPFIQAVSPEKIVYTVGTKNPFGHPHQEVVERYGKFELESFYTTQGDVIFEW